MPPAPTRPVTKCPDCSGTGVRNEGTVCQTCGGTGVVPRRPPGG